MIEKLRIIANKYIEKYQENPNQLKKYQLIKEILNQKDCFLNMNIEYAYSILRDLKIPEKDLKNVYKKLILPMENNN